MKNLSDFINESRGKHITESAGNIPPEVFDGAKGVIKDAKLKDENTVIVKVDNKPGISTTELGYHLSANPEAWIFMGSDPDDDDFTAEPKTYIINTTMRDKGELLKLAVYGDEYMDHVPDCTFISDGPLEIDFDGLGMERCTFEGPITVIGADDRGGNKCKKGAKIA